jgi:hypothetical protein
LFSKNKRAGFFQEWNWPEQKHVWI